MPILSRGPFRLRGSSLALVSILIASLPTAPAAAQVVIKMATLAPDGSVWDQILSEMGAEWQEATGGEVTLRIYPGGVAGDEPDLVRKMRIGQLHGAALTVAGLTAIDPVFESFQVPLFFNSYDELFHVLETLRSRFEKRFEERGFVLVQWVHGGWVHFFSKKPIHTTNDLKGQKLFVWAGDDHLVQLWRKNGYQPVPLAVTDIMTGLQTGMIEVYPSTPLAALSMQWFRQTSHMQRLGIGPLIGGTVISKRVWDQMSAESQAKIREVARRGEARMETEVPKQDQRAVEQMRQRGLEVTDLTPAQRAEWTEVAAEFTRFQRQQLAEPEILDEIRRLRDAFRKQRGQTQP